ncbi:hypothetical protein [Hydrogenophaga sp.]|uniref:hypothetical protein n=1 Tax=Hydrogenophaga sp. TaxID=1904254 RepID=UPI0027196906|nr:hypothetical protein [Hydrogenophaga sp.]MDO9434044.1 hypothetical protein [Hydrogenophaga sp.]
MSMLSKVRFDENVLPMQNFFIGCVLLTAGAAGQACAEARVVEVHYCVTQSTVESAGYPCLQAVTLSIPEAYFRSAPSSKSLGSSQSLKYLDVAYPDMKAWRDVSWLDRKDHARISLDIRGTATPMLADLYRKRSFGKSQVAKHAAQQFDLIHYVIDNNWADFYLPLDQSIPIKINCANGGGANIEERGCYLDTQISLRESVKSPRTHESANLVVNVRYRFERKLLPQWRQIATSMHAQIIKFVKN